MSTSAPDTQAPAPGGLTADEASFLGQVLTANANWSASIHNAALDGQERASNEWAERYLSLASLLDHLLSTATWDERETELFRRLGYLAESQGHLPSSAADQLDRYRDRLEMRAEEGK